MNQIVFIVLKSNTVHNLGEQMFHLLAEKCLQKQQ